MEEVNKIIRELWIKIYKGGGTKTDCMHIIPFSLQVYVIDFMWFAVEFVTFAVEFILFACEFVHNKNAKVTDSTAKPTN